ncbi:hypothetical protein [Nocardioides sp. CER19]|uniref:hypothetical protein n=1 Tax=Nocardioides sp. CER19 TaxID=3038538 RepID=UPI002448FC6C|nr:hypothetical protein [Nocardioides sp. CER19]MDH2415101.1 hypothetical protein [Nocardioides sp. CER19]
MTSQPEEFEPQTRVDPTEGISEDDAVDTLEAEETDDRETYLDSERRAELADPDDEDEDEDEEL